MADIVKLASVFAKVAKSFEVKDSEIHGQGAFAIQDFGLGDEIGLALKLKIDDEATRVYDRTLLGRKVNHSGTCNSEVQKIGDNFYLIAKFYIPTGEEITADYGRFTEKLVRESAETGKEFVVR